MLCKQFTLKKEKKTNTNATEMCDKFVYFYHFIIKYLLDTEFHNIEFILEL